MKFGRAVFNAAKTEAVITLLAIVLCPYVLNRYTSVSIYRYVATWSLAVLIMFPIFFLVNLLERKE